MFIKMIANTIPAENIIIKAIPTIKANERHPIITNKSTFQGLNTESAFFCETLAKKGSTFDDGIFWKFFLKYIYF